MTAAPWVQSESEQRPHKLSYHLNAKGAEGEAVVKQLEQKLATAGVSAKARLCTWLSCVGFCMCLLACRRMSSLA